MNDLLFIDAHTHFGYPGIFFTPEILMSDLLARMDQLSFSHAVCLGNQLAFTGKGAAEGLSVYHELFEMTNGRLYYLGVYHPKYGEQCIKSLHNALSFPGFRGIKIHPSFHNVSADDPSYEPAWEFASRHNQTLATHSWSPSSYNPVQILSTPGRFEKFIKRYPGVRFVLAHAGGRGVGRGEAVRLVREYPNVYLDFAGDIFCNRLIENLVETISADRFMYGSDFPWFDLCANFSRVLLADISDTDKAKILRNNAAFVYRIGQQPD